MDETRTGTVTGVSAVAKAPGAARDNDLDDYRALVLIWVLLLHCLYWLGLVGPRWNVAKSLLLFEMPVLFFVAGASNGLGKARTAGSFYKSRLSRILIPYWVYAAVCLAVEEWKLPAALRPSVPDYRWLVPTGVPASAVAPVSWHLWFVPVYLTVMALFPWLRSAFDRLSSWRRLAPLAALAAGVVAFDYWGVRREFPRYVVFYSAWAYLGLYYPLWKARPWPRGAVLALSAGAYGVLGGLLAYGVYQPDFQWNKFPTNAAFLLLCVGHFGVLVLAAPGVRAFARTAAVRRLTAPYRAYGYTIYLFHALGFTGLMTAFERWPAAYLWAQAHPALTIAAAFPALVVVVPVLAWPFSVAERFRPGARAAADARRADRPGRLDAPHAGEAAPALARVVGPSGGRVPDRTDSPR